MIVFEFKVFEFRACYEDRNTTIRFRNKIPVVIVIINIVYNVDNDYNYRDFISESNGGISVFIACTEPKILNLSQSFSTERRNWDVVERSFF